MPCKYRSADNIIEKILKSLTKFLQSKKNFKSQQLLRDDGL